MPVDEIPALGWKVEAAECVRTRGSSCCAFRWAPNLGGPAMAAILGGNAARVLGTNDWT